MMLVFSIHWIFFLEKENVYYQSSERNNKKEENYVETEHFKIVLPESRIAKHNTANSPGIGDIFRHSPHQSIVVKFNFCIPFVPL